MTFDWLYFDVGIPNQKEGFDAKTSRGILFANSSNPFCANRYNEVSILDQKIRSYLSIFPTYNSHFLLTGSGNSFLENSHFSKKNSHFYLIESGNLSGNLSGNYKWEF